MSSPDIRAGISLIAALSGKGTSTIQNIEQIDRGYERIDERLRAIGAKNLELNKRCKLIMSKEQAAVKGNLLQYITCLAIIKGFSRFFWHFMP
jgi:hypothetical protein